MGSRLELHAELVKFLPNVYFQPPSNITMVYPCIVYNMTPSDIERANNGIYLSTQGYQLTVIDKNPDSDVAKRIQSQFPSCEISQYFVSDNLNHTTLSLYY